MCLKEYYGLLKLGFFIAQTIGCIGYDNTVLTIVSAEISQCAKSKIDGARKTISQTMKHVGYKPAVP